MMVWFSLVPLNLNKWPTCLGKPKSVHFLILAQILCSISPIIEKICHKKEKKKQASIKNAKQREKNKPTIIMHAGEITDLPEVLF